MGYIFVTRKQGGKLSHRDIEHPTGQPRRYPLGDIARWGRAFNFLFFFFPMFLKKRKFILSW